MRHLEKSLYWDQSRMNLASALWFGLFFFSFQSSFLALAGPGDRKWGALSGENVFSTPAIGPDNTLYVGGWDGWVYALDGANGKEKWRFRPSGGVDCSPAVGMNGIVYIGCNDGKMYALDGAAGSKKWEFQTGDMVRSSPAIAADGSVIFGSDDGKLYALDGATGVKKWEFLTGLVASAPPVIGSDGTVYVGSYDRRLYALDGDTGQKKWEFLTGAWVVNSSPAIGADNTIYFGAGDSNVYALDGATGQRKWIFKTGDQVYSSPAIGPDGTLYIGSDDQKLYALDGATGQKKWEFPTGYMVWKSPTVGADGTVYLGSGYGGNFYAIDGTTGQPLWTNRTGPSISSGIALGTNGTVYFAAYWVGLIALEGNSPNGLANSPWPKFHGNARNTGQAPIPMAPPRITSLFDSGMMLEGASTNLWVSVVAYPPRSIQWRVDGRAICGATNSFFAIAAASATNAGAYTVVVSNSFGMVTNDPVVLGVNNVVSTNYPGLVLTAPKDTQLQVQSADSIGGPWFPLADLTLPSNPFPFVDRTAANVPQRFYRTTTPNRLEARLFNGWDLNAPTGSRYRIEYVEAATGYTNWQFLTNLTLPSSPYRFIDTTTTNHPARFYRTTPLR